MISNNNNNDNNDDNSNNGNLKVNILRRGPSCPPFPRRYGTWSVKTEDLEWKPFGARTRTNNNTRPTCNTRCRNVTRATEITGERHHHCTILTSPLCAIPTLHPRYYVACDLNDDFFKGS